MTTNDIKQKILDRIEAEHLTPRPAWEFTLTNWTFWLLGGIAVVVGALAVAAGIFEIENTGWQFYASTHSDFFAFFLEAVPLLWLLVLLLFVYAGYANIRRTKRGYRYPFSIIIAGAVLTSITLGTAIFAGGFGQDIEEGIGDHPPFYRPVLMQEHDLWSRPNKGLIGGQVLSVAPDLSSFTLKDFNGQTWKVSTANLDENELVLLARGGNIRVIGLAATSTGQFLACFVFPFPVFGGGSHLPMSPLAVIASTSERNEPYARSEECKGIRPYGSSH